MADREECQHSGVHRWECADFSAAGLKQCRQRRAIGEEQHQREEEHLQLAQIKLSSIPGLRSLKQIGDPGSFGVLVDHQLPSNSDTGRINRLPRQLVERPCFLILVGWAVLLDAHNQRRADERGSGDTHQ